MTFEEAYEKLSTGEIAEVAAEMRSWHPAILGQMLLAVQAAKEARYPSPHPDYFNALFVLQHREREPSQAIARFDRDSANIKIARVVSALQKEEE